MNTAAPEYVRTIIAFRPNKRERIGVEEEAKAI